MWPEPYTGVWHLSGNGKDSPRSATTAPRWWGASSPTVGFAKGLQLDGGKRDHITLKGDIKLVAGAAGCTFSAWINPTKIENSINGMIIMTVGKWFNNNHNSYTDFNINAAGQMIRTSIRGRTRRPAATRAFCPIRASSRPTSGRG